MGANPSTNIRTVLNRTKFGRAAIGAAAGIAVAMTFMVFGLGQAQAAKSDYVQNASWAWGGAYGPTLHIQPTLQGRLYGRANPGGVMSEALRKSGLWMWTNSLYNQLRCHLDIAAFKGYWNLDVGRPDVGYWSTVKAGCNPR